MTDTLLGDQERRLANGPAPMLPAIGDLFPTWQRDAACKGAGPEAWFPGSQGGHALEAKRVCAGCPVLVECLDAAVASHEDHGVWGGAGGGELRTMSRAVADRPHGAHGPAGCECRWCVELGRHRRNLDAIAGGGATRKGGTAGRRSGEPGVRFGPGASHGHRGTYSRGCRCRPCRWSASALGQALARCGLSTAAHWDCHAPPDWEDIDYAEARKRPDEVATEQVERAVGVLLVVAGHAAPTACIRPQPAASVEAGRMSGEREFWSEAELARRWGVHASTVSRWVGEGRLQASRLSSQTVRFDRDAVETFEAEAKGDAA